MVYNAHSVLFCALFASTFVHEIWTKTIPANSSTDTGLAKADRVADYDLTLQAEDKILIITNKTANAALVIDVAASTFLLLNGTKTSGIVIDINNQQGAYIPSGLWDASCKSVKEFLNSLDSGIKGLLDRDECDKFKLDSVKPAVLKEVTTIVIKLVNYIEEDLKWDNKLALELVISIVKVKNELRDLEGLTDLIGDEEISLSVDIMGLASLLEGFEFIMEKTGGNLASSMKQGVKFDPKDILGAKNGLVVLNNILRELGQDIDLKPLAEILVKPESLFKLIAKLGGEDPVGITGVFKVVGEIVALIMKNSKPEQVITNLLMFEAYSSTNGDGLAEELNSTLDELLNTLKQINATESLEKMVKIVKNLKEGTLTICECNNISAIINKLLTSVDKPEGTGLERIVDILLFVPDIAEVSKSIPYLLLVLICKMDTPAGIMLLNRLGIDANIDFGNIAGSILKSILSTVSDLPSLLQGNICEVLKKLPVIGNVFDALCKAVDKVSYGEYNLEKLLDASNLVRNLIKGLVSLTAGIALDISSSIVDRSKSILECVTNNTAYVGVAITVTVSVSASN